MLSLATSVLKVAAVLSLIAAVIAAVMGAQAGVWGVLVTVGYAAGGLISFGFLYCIASITESVHRLAHGAPEPRLNKWQEEIEARGA